jgi:hypothetical protein
MKNFHLPLTERSYNTLKAEADRMRLPATVLARHAVDSWLKQRARKARRSAIAAYAAEFAGMAIDLDPNLEAAAVEHLVNSERRRK